MEQEQDIRWQQRYANYHKACQRLIAVTESGMTVEDLSELEQEGIVQRFEYTFELSWKVLQDLLTYKGYEFMSGPNGTMRWLLRMASYPTTMDGDKWQSRATH